MSRLRQPETPRLRAQTSVRPYVRCDAVLTKSPLAPCAQALRAKPEVNASWMGDFIRYYDDVDITVAVQTPNGLMVPIVKHADELGLLEISAQVKALAKKVRIWRA